MVAFMETGRQIVLMMDGKPFNANMSKYTNMAKRPQTISNAIVRKLNETITLKVDLKPHSVKRIKLSPQ